MSKHRKSEERPKRPNDRPPAEGIVTCSCSHKARQHSEMGCMFSECECAVERSMLVVGKVQAVDKM